MRPCYFIRIQMLLSMIILTLLNPSVVNGGKKMLHPLMEKLPNPRAQTYPELMHDLAMIQPINQLIMDGLQTKLIKYYQMRPKSRQWAIKTRAEIQDKMYYELERLMNNTIQKYKKAYKEEFRLIPQHYLENNKQIKTQKKWLWYVNEYGFKKNFIPSKQQSKFFMHKIEEVAVIRQEDKRELIRMLGHGGNETFDVIRKRAENFVAVNEAVQNDDMDEAKRLTEIMTKELDQIRFNFRYNDVWMSQVNIEWWQRGFYYTVYNILHKKYQNQQEQKRKLKPKLMKHLQKIHEKFNKYKKEKLTGQQNKSKNDEKDKMKAKQEVKQQS